MPNMIARKIVAAQRAVAKAQQYAMETDSVDAETHAVLCNVLTVLTMLELRQGNEKKLRRLSLALDQLTLDQGKDA